MSAPLLVEIHTEELPPMALNTMAQRFAENVSGQLKEAGFANDAHHQWFASPRRLAVLVDNVIGKQQDQIKEKRGPSLSAAFDGDGNPTKAAQGFAASVGSNVNELETLKTDKGEWLVARKRVTGRNLASVLAGMIETALKQLPIPKRMRWGLGQYEFVRPVHSILAVHGRETIVGELFGLAFSNTTRGHRVLANNATIEITDAVEYVDRLQTEGHVFVAAAKRRQMVKEQVEKLAQEVGGTPYQPDSGWDEGLLDLVTALVEYPQAILGRFDKHYMELPNELLVTSMKDHQKYFAVFNAEGELLPYFITVANIRLDDPQRVIAGNERVLRARLDDAEFFWETDAKLTLEQRCDDLDRLLYHQKIGSVGSRVQRMLEGLDWLAAAVAASSEEVSAAKRASALMKADLVSEVVGEFPELQGTIGRYYAERDGEAITVAQAIEEHYLPRFSGDALPKSVVGAMCAAVERIDGLITLFGAGEAPSGTRDRYALRRQALGLLRLILDNDWQWTLAAMIEHWPNPNPLSDEHGQELVTFLLERLRHELVQSRGYKEDAFNAVIAVESQSVVDIAKRVAAVSQFVEQDEATAAKLSAGLKRAGNFLSKAGARRKTNAAALAKLVVDEEKALDKAVTRAQDDIENAVASGNYIEALQSAAALQPHIDAFFDKVLVLDEDTEVRNARLALLDKTVDALTCVADISHLQDS